MLTERQKLFVEAYTGNGVEAARAAGYEGDDATLAVRASKLLRLGKIQDAIGARQKPAFDAKARPLIATREARQEFWTAVMNDAGADMKDRLKASELLGKSEADFKERVEHSGGVSIGVVDPYAEGDE